MTWKVPLQPCFTLPPGTGRCRKVSLEPSLLQDEQSHLSAWIHRGAVPAPGTPSIMHLIFFYLQALNKRCKTHCIIWFPSYKFLNVVSQLHHLFKRHCGPSSCSCSPAMSRVGNSTPGWPRTLLLILETQDRHPHTWAHCQISFYTNREKQTCEGSVLSDPF